MIAVVRASAPSVVFHLSSKFVAEHRPGDVESLVRDNILFGLQLLEAMQIAGAARLLNTGSAWQHFHNRDYSPVCLYAATKQAFADILAYYVEVHHFRAVTLELTDTYGAGDGRRKLIPIMRDAERGGDELAMVPADVPMDFVHVDDAVEAFVVAARRLLASDVAGHEIFAVRSGAPVTALELFATWERARGVRIAARWGERPLRAREVLQPWTQGTPLPDWQPKISLEEGLRTL